MICRFCKGEVAEGTQKCSYCGLTPEQPAAAPFPPQTQGTENSNGQNPDYLSRTENSVLMLQAREALRGQWPLFIGTWVVFILITGAANAIPGAGVIISLLISGPLAVGFSTFSLSVSRRQNPKLAQIFEGFNNFGTALGAYLLMALFIILWTLLLIVPGIIAAFSYSLVFYILAENDKMGAREALKRSKELMNGNKMKMFYLGCRFIGWGLLGILTLGIGFLWLVPYSSVSFAKFYDDIIKKK